MKSIKNQVKENPVSVFINPVLWPGVFLLVLNVLWTRLKYSSETVYYSVESIKEINSFLKEHGTSNFILRNCTPNDLVLIKSVRRNNGKESDIEFLYKKRLNTGDSCFVLMHNDIPVSYLWTAIKKTTIEATGFPIDLPGKCFAVYDVYTSISHRGKGYYIALLKLVLEHFNRLGFQTVSLWVMKHNQNAVKVQNNVGFKSISKEIGYIALLGFKKRIIKEVNYPTSYLIINHP